MPAPRTRDPSAAEAGGAWLKPLRTVVLWALSVEVAVLVVTGIALFFVYRPSASAAWNQVIDGAPGVGWFPGTVRVLHRSASAVAIPTALAAGVLLVIQGWRTARRLGGIAVAAALTVLTAAASFTGFLLPWDQLALWAVTVGTNMKGYRPLFGDEVRFVLIGGTEVSAGTIVRWLLVHTLLLGPAVAALVVIAWRRHRAVPARVEPTVTAA